MAPLMFDPVWGDRSGATLLIESTPPRYPKKHEASKRSCLKRGKPI